MAIPFVSFRMRWMSAAATAVSLLALLATISLSGNIGVAASHERALDGKLGASLQSVASDRPAVRTQVIVRATRGTSPVVAHRLVKRLGGKALSRDLPVINGFGAELRAGDAARLVRDPRIEAVSLNGPVGTRSQGGSSGSSQSPVCPTAGDDDEDNSGSSTPYSNRKGRKGRKPADPARSTRLLRTSQQRSMNVDDAWSEATGKGVGVAVIDTGIAGDLPDFNRIDGRSGSRVVASAVTNPCATNAGDGFGHGTHVAGLIAGNSLNLDSRDPNYGRYMGIAPEADLISVKVADEGGSATVLDVIYGLQFAVDHRDQLNIGVINLSLSSTVPESYRTDPLDAAVESAWFKGIVVVAAAGNEGNSADAVSYAPANDPYVITAGAVDDQGTSSIRDDKLAFWSSRGLTRDGVRKPEVLAPGVGLISTLAPGSLIAAQCPECVVSGRYLRISGTSMSAAMVSGVSALVREKHPEWSPNQVKGALQRTLQNVAGVGGEVDALAALRARRPNSNRNLSPNSLVDASTGEIDWARASFRRASFRDAAGSELDASWSRASFRCDCSLAPSGSIDPERASFRRASFRRTMSLGK